MISRKQKSLFRKSLNKTYPYVILEGCNGTLYEFRNNRKTFKLGINPIKKKKKV